MVNKLGKVTLNVKPEIHRKLMMFKYKHGLIDVNEVITKLLENAELDK